MASVYRRALLLPRNARHSEGAKRLRKLAPYGVSLSRHSEGAKRLRKLAPYGVSLSRHSEGAKRLRNRRSERVQGHACMSLAEPQGESPKGKLIPFGVPLVIPTFL